MQSVLRMLDEDADKLNGGCNYWRQIAERENEIHEFSNQWRSISIHSTSKEEVELLHMKMRKVLSDYRRNNSKLSK